MFIPQETIRRKRNGECLTETEIQHFAAGITSGAVTDGQIAAFAMAVYFQGMSMDERAALTIAMRDSGKVLNWQSLDLPGPVVDKHSTGGVGDTVSLMLGPMIAACGGYVPMISGRGLGHTGGTLDKFNAIPGYNVSPDFQQLQQVVKEIGVAIIGQTSEIAPADKRFYGIRDVTATVESEALITASILSKKLAAGLDALVMDVKTGNGAFLTEYDEAKQLANSIVQTAHRAGMPTSCVITDMNQVLATTAGNAVEVQEAIDFLTGKHQDARMREVTVSLCAQMLVLTGLQANIAAAENVLNKALDSGAAAERFAKMVALLGGPTDILENSHVHLPKANIVRPLFPSEQGWISGMDTRAVGMAVVALGGGRTRSQDPINYAVGLSDIVKVGDKVDNATPIAMIHADSEAAWKTAAEQLQSAISWNTQAPGTVTDSKHSSSAVLDVVTLADTKTNGEGSV